MGAKFNPNVNLGRELVNVFGETIEQGGFVVERETKRQIQSQGRVDTGNMLNSVSTDVVRRGTSIRVDVGSNVHYFIYQEFGTQFIRGGHMLASGLEAAAKWLARRGFKIDYEVRR